MISDQFRLVAKYAAICAMAVFLTSACVWGQAETGQISGTVTDPTGAVVPGAAVAVRNVATGAMRNTTTGAAGTYVVPNLQPGTYNVVITASGFAAGQQQIVVSVGSRNTIDMTLDVGKTGTTVEVEATATAVNVESQVLQQVITSKEIVELPTLTRNPYALVGTVGNVSGNTPDGRGVGYAINGQRAASTNVLLDGTANNDEFSATVGQPVPLDSVQEFSVITSNFTAEYGRATGGIVNVATRSGSNSFHGTAYEFNRVSDLASGEFNDNANGIRKPVFTRNQFGYSVGGPVKKDKLFFFSSTEWIRVRSAANLISYIPTTDFIGLAAAPTQNYFKTYGAVAPNLTMLGTVSRAQLAARGTNICAGLPATSRCAAIPMDLPLFQRLNYSIPSDSGGGIPQNTYMPVARMDYNLSDRTQIYGRYALYSEFDFDGTNSNSPYQGFNTGNTNYNNAMMLNVTHTFSPKFVSQTKVNFNRLNNVQPLDGQPSMPGLYLSSGSTASRILGDRIALPGYLPYGPGTAIPFGGPQNFYQLYEDMSYILGTHQIRFGGMYSHLRDNRTFGAYQNGVSQIGNNLPRGIENFLGGVLYQYTTAIDPKGKYPCADPAHPTPDCTVALPVGQPSFSRSNRYNDWALYVQDNWKATRRLTLDFGVRWEVYGTQHNKNPQMDSNFYFGTGGNVYEQIANGTVQLAPDSPLGKLWKTDYNNFGPRLGAAWDITGTGRWSLRGGYGMGYERNFGNVTFNVIQNPPNYAVVSLVGGVDLPIIPIPIDNAGPLSGSSGTKALPVVQLRAVNPNIDSAKADFWSAALEHKFNEAIMMAAEYSGSRGTQQYGIANVNRIGAGNYYLGKPCTPGTDGDPGTCTGRLVSQRYSNINLRTNGGFSTYNGLNIRTQIRAYHGLTSAINYTWSHAIDTLSDTFSGSGNQYNLGWLDPFNPGVDKGDAYFDVRHRLSLSAAWDIPGPRSSSAWAKQALGGWTLAPIVSIQSGPPYSIYDCTNGYNVCPYVALNGATPRTPDTPLQATATPNTYNYFDIGKYVAKGWYNPKMGVSDWGPFPSNMIGRNFFRTPGSWNIDFAVHKQFRFTERLAMQLRGEFFNVLNHPNLYVNTGDADVYSLDYMTAGFSGRRNVQLAAKLIF